MAQILPLSVKTSLLLFKKSGKDPVSETFRYNRDTTQFYNKSRGVYEMRCSLPVYQVTKHGLLQSVKSTLINIHVLMVFELQQSAWLLLQSLIC